MSLIYLITNLANGKQYVGQTSLPAHKRLAKHYRDSLYGRSTYLCRAIRKYGIENFSIEILEEHLSHEDALSQEKFFIETLGTNLVGYNMTHGGEGTSGYRHSDDTRRRMSLSRVGKTHSENTKKLLSVQRQGELNVNYQKIYSDIERRKISDKTRGANNPRAKSFLVTLPNGEDEVVYDRSGFCKKHNLNYWSVVWACDHGKPHKGYIWTELVDKSVT